MKITQEIMDFILEHSDMSNRPLAELIQKEFDIEVSYKTVEKYKKSSQKGKVPKKFPKFNAETFYLETLSKDETFNKFYEGRADKPSLIQHIRDEYGLTVGQAKLLLVVNDQQNPLPEKPEPTKAPRTPIDEHISSLNLHDALYQWKNPIEDTNIINYVQVKKIDPELNRSLSFFIELTIGSNRSPMFSRASFSLPSGTNFLSQKSFDNIKEGPIVPYELRDLQETYYKFLDFQSQFIYFQKIIYHKIIALTSLATYFIDVFYTFPYLDIHSPEHGCGKTNCMSVYTQSSFHGVTTTSPTPANLFRPLQHGLILTMGFDELDEKLQDPVSRVNLVDILDAGYKRGILVRRMIEAESKAFPCFGPKAWTRIKDIKATLQARAIYIPMIKNMGIKELDEEPENKKFQHLRDQAYILRYDLMNEVKRVYKEICKSKPLRGRSGEVYIPILTLAKLIDEELYEEVLLFAVKEEEAKRVDVLDPYKRIMVRALLEEMADWSRYEDWDGTVKGTKIVDAFNKKLELEGYLPIRVTPDGDRGIPLSAKKVYPVFRGLGFRGTEGKGRAIYCKVEPTKLRELVDFYGIATDEETSKYLGVRESEGNEGKTLCDKALVSSGMGSSQNNSKVANTSTDIVPPPSKRPSLFLTSLTPEETEESLPHCYSGIIDFIDDLCNRDWAQRFLLNTFIKKGQQRGFELDDLHKVLFHEQTLGHLIEVKIGLFEKKQGYEFPRTDELI